MLDNSFFLSSFLFWRQASLGGSKHGVSQMFMLQQFSIVISHCSAGGCGLYVSGTFLFTMIRFLILGRLRNKHVYTVKPVIVISIRNTKQDNAKNALS
jgi:hypothetical protein